MGSKNDNGWMAMYENLKVYQRERDSGLFRLNAIPRIESSDRGFTLSDAGKGKTISTLIERTW
jgi:hypothetical protein